MKADVLADLDPATLAGKEVTVVGATAPLNPDGHHVTPVSIEVAPVTPRPGRRPAVLVGLDVTKIYGGTHALAE